MNRSIFYSININDKIISKLECSIIPSNGEDSDIFKVSFSTSNNNSKYVLIKFVRSCKAKIEKDIISTIPNSDFMLLSAKVVHQELLSSEFIDKELYIHSNNYLKYFQPHSENIDIMDSKILKCFQIYENNILSSHISIYDLYLSLPYEWKQIKDRVQILEVNRKLLHSLGQLEYKITSGKYDEILLSTTKANNSSNKWFNIVPIHAKDDFVFVIMPIKKDDIESYYQDVIKSQINTTKEWDLTCWRSDDDKIPGTIDNQIYTYIMKSKFIIADLTGLNPNVMYELGLTHAFNKNVLIITQNSLDTLPFDLKHHKAFKYSSEKELIKIIQDNIPIFRKMT